MNAAVLDAIGSIADFVLGYAVTLAALGVLTMALLEAAKKLFTLQGRFHGHAVRDWLKQASRSEPDSGRWGGAWRLGARSQYVVPPGARADSAGGDAVYRWRAAYAELLHLTTGLPHERAAGDPNGDAAAPAEDPYSRNVSRALFEMDLARMMAQIQDASDAALNNPERYPQLFAFLTRGCANEDRDEWLEAMRRRERDFGFEQDQPYARRVADLYGRIRLLVKRQLDSFQTVTMFRWREYNQAWAVTLGAVLMFVAQIIVVLNEGGGALDAMTPVVFVKIVFVSLLGGMLAPVAKDLVDTLGRVKRSG